MFRDFVCVFCVLMCCYLARQLMMTKVNDNSDASWLSNNDSKWRWWMQTIAA